MRIAIHSDLHIDKNFTENPICRQSIIKARGADVIILAGDISDDRELSFLYAKAVADKYPKSQIVFVAGNHEFWGGDIVNTDQYFRECFSDVGNAHYLENQFITVKNGTETVVFLGSTHWSDFELRGKNESHWQAMQCQVVPDFRHIKIHGEPFSVSHSAALCKKSHDWIDIELSQKHTAKKVLVTHFPIAPVFNSQNTRVSSWFANDHSSLISKHKPALVVSGHSHDNVDIDLPDSRLVSNQAGYGPENSCYRRDLVIQI